MRKGLLCIVLMLLASVALAQDSVIYVDGAFGDDQRTGLSWGTSVRKINTGIARAIQFGCHEIWVTTAEYAECVYISDYYIWLYGGFRGTEVERDERDATGHASVIYGSCNEATGNYCPAVTITNASMSIVDGFTISGGGGALPFRRGGGFYIIYSDYVKIWNNTITGNYAIYGGGLYVGNCANFWLKDNSITSNHAIEEGGGLEAVSVNFGAEFGIVSTPKMENNSFTNNFGGNRGGGIILDQACSGYIWNNTIGSENIAVKGAGMFLDNSSSPLIHENTIFSNAAGEDGGGVYIQSSSPRLLLNTISSNTISDEDGRGGGIYIKSCSPVIERNRIKSNTCLVSTGGWGGGIGIEAGSPTIVNNIIDYNTVKEAGGGLCLWSASNPTLTNNTLVHNDAYRLIIGGENPDCYGVGGGMALFGSQATLRNNIFYDSWAANCIDIYCDATSSVDSNYNCYFCQRIEECGGMSNNCNWSMGEHDTSGDPDFIDGDYHLGRDSAVIDKGDNSASGLISVDYPDGDPRKLDGDGDGTATVDMGADEYWKPVTDWKLLKGTTDGTPVEMIGYVTVGYPDFFYIEREDRVMGIGVDKEAHTAGLGQYLRVYGRIGTNSYGERYISANTVEVASTATKILEPLAMNNKAIGGNTIGLQTGVWSWNNGENMPPWAQAPGLNNIGLLVSVWGKITWVNSDPTTPENEYLYIDDGSMRVDGTYHNPVPEAYQPNFGIRVICVGESLSPLLMQDMYVQIIGISSCIKFGSDPVRLIKMRDPGSFLIFE